MKKSKPEKWKITVDHGDSITEVYVVNPRKIFPQQVIDVIDTIEDIEAKKAEAEKKDRKKKNGNDR